MESPTYESYNPETRLYLGAYTLPVSILDPVNKDTQPVNTLNFAPSRAADKNEVLSGQ